MEKIQIQFKESDYKIYHDYCLKYYQAHDTARKHDPMHAFLDLFETGDPCWKSRTSGRPASSSRKSAMTSNGK